MLVLTLVMLGALAVLAVGTVEWAGESHPTHCTYNQYQEAIPGRDVGPYIGPIVIACITVALVLSVLLLFLSRRRRVLFRERSGRPGAPSMVVAGVTWWFAAVYAIVVFGPQGGSDSTWSLLEKAVALPPLYLMIGVVILCLYGTHCWSCPGWASLPTPRPVPHRRAPTRSHRWRSSTRCSAASRPPRAPTCSSPGSVWGLTDA